MLRITLKRLDEWQIRLTVSIGSFKLIDQTVSLTRDNPESTHEVQ